MRPRRGSPTTKDITLYHPKGCPQCAQTGYTGRISIIEMLPMTDPLRSLVMKHATPSELRNEAIARRHGDDVRGRPAQGGARHHDVRGSAARHARRLSACTMPGLPRTRPSMPSGDGRHRRARGRERERDRRPPARPGHDADAGRARSGGPRVGGNGAAPRRRRTASAPPLVRAKTVTRDQRARDHARARDAAAGGPAARPRARDPDRPRRAPPAATLLQQIRDDVRGGKSLSQALDARRDVFSRFYVNIVRAGEAGGALGVVLTRLADTMERNKELRESVKSALIYPTILIGVAVLSVMRAAGLGGAAVRADVRAGGQGAAAADAGRRSFLGTDVKQWWWAIAAFVVLCRAVDPPPAARSAVARRWDARLLRAAAHRRSRSPRSRSRASRARSPRCSATA